MNILLVAKINHKSIMLSEYQIQNLHGMTVFHSRIATRLAKSPSIFFIYFHAFI